MNRFYLPILVGIVVLVAVLWNTPFIYPLKVLVVFFHESSHALMTLLTGGSVKEMEITVNQGGHVLSAGGNRFLTLTAGYLGSLFWGASIYLLAVKSHWDKFISMVLGGILVIITLVFISNTFGMMFGLLTGGAMMVLGKFGNDFFNDLVLRVIGITSMIYVPLDIYSDTISRSHLRSDARMLAEEIGGATVMWGGIWIVISLVVLFFVVRAKDAGRRPSPIRRSSNLNRYQKLQNNR